MNISCKIEASVIEELTKKYPYSFLLSIDDSDTYLANMRKLLRMSKGSNGCLSGKTLMNALFPQNPEFDVFISHSHKDKGLAIFLRGYLKRYFGLNSFIDSMVWHNSYDFLKEFDECFCKMENGNYDYEKRNFSTSNIFLMLANALSLMMDSCPIVVFIASPNSLVQDNISLELSNDTHSPWLFHELNTMQLLRIKPLVGLIKESSERITANLPKIEFNIPSVASLPLLTKEILEKHSILPDDKQKTVCSLCQQLLSNDVMRGSC